MGAQRRRALPVAALATASLALPAAAVGGPPQDLGPAAGATTPAAGEEMVDRVIPGGDYTMIGFSSEAGGYPDPGDVDGTAEAIGTDDLVQTWVIDYDDGVPTEEPPHWIAFDVGEDRDLSALEYTVKAGQGHIEDYDVYVSDDDAVLDDPESSPAWGEPVASGTFDEEHDVTHQASFDEPAHGSYVKLEAGSSHDPAGMVAASLLRVSEQVPAELELPEVIPAITGDWQPGRGSFTLTDRARLVTGDGVSASTAAIFAEELSAILGAPVPIAQDNPRPGDVVLNLDGAAGELGEEGYALDIGAQVTISAPEPVGVFYGTRTLAQMFDQSLELPGGHITDVPAYAERGLTICACQINISEEWIDRILDEMAHFKLNYALLELKMLSEEYPETHTWGYYTREQVETFVDKAAERGIDIIPEINTPGHMAVWLENKPELQLQDRHGELDEMRLDISRPESFEFYTSLVDEYLEVFDSDSWHMGADEYMIYSDFEEFPQLEEAAQERWGPQATPDDLYVDFINRVNEYVQTEHGQTLRIWNDGLVQRNEMVDLDSDIVVEHWYDSPSEPALPSELLDAGHQVMNSSVELYLTRGGPQMDTEHLYNTRWHVGYFHGEAIDAGAEGLTGAKVSLWPDHADVDTENQVEASVFMPLRYIAQMTWSDDYDLLTYAEFEALAQDIGRPLGWQNIEREPLADGNYQLRTEQGYLTLDDEGVLVVDEGSAPVWQLSVTADHYYRIEHTEEELCLDVIEGQERLGVPLESGVPVAAVACAETNMQKWQVIAHEDGLEILNAITQQRLSVADHSAVQLPPDVSADRWTALAH